MNLAHQHLFLLVGVLVCVDFIFNIQGTLLGELQNDSCGEWIDFTQRYNDVFVEISEFGLFYLFLVFMLILLRDEMIAEIVAVSTHCRTHWRWSCLVFLFVFSLLDYGRTVIHVEFFGGIPEQCVTLTDEIVRVDFGVNDLFLSLFTCTSTKRFTFSSSDGPHDQTHTEDNEEVEKSSCHNESRLILISEISVLHEGHGHNERNQQDVGVDRHKGLVGLDVVLTLQKEADADQGHKQERQVDVVEGETNVDLGIINPSLPLRNSLNLAKSDFEESCIE